MDPGPRVDRDLARRLLREVQSRVEVQIGMDYTMEMEEMLGEERLGQMMWRWIVVESSSTKQAAVIVAILDE